MQVNSSKFNRKKKFILAGLSENLQLLAWKMVREYGSTILNVLNTSELSKLLGNRKHPRKQNVGIWGRRKKDSENSERPSIGTCVCVCVCPFGQAMSNLFQTKMRTGMLRIGWMAEHDQL